MKGDVFTRRLLFFGILSGALLFTRAFAEDVPEVGKIYMDLLLDASNSMHEEVEGVEKIDTAKKVISSLTSSLQAPLLSE